MGYRHWFYRTNGTPTTYLPQNGDPKCDRFLLCTSNVGFYQITLAVVWWIGLDWAVFYVPANTVYVLLWETVFTVRKTQPTVSQYWRKSYKEKNQTTKTTQYTYAQTIHKIRTTSPLVYTNMGWLGEGSHKGQGRQASAAVGLPPRYPLVWWTKLLI